MAYRLRQEHPDARVVVFERKSRLGGRIKTIRPSAADGGGWYEAGASRIADRHVRVRRLAAELGCVEKRGHPLGENARAGAAQKAVADRLVERAHELAREVGPNALHHLTMADVLALTATDANDDVAALFRAWGFSATLQQMNAEDFLRHAIKNYTCENYYTVVGGLQTLVDRLAERLSADPMARIVSATRVSAVLHEHDDAAGAPSRRRRRRLRVTVVDDDDDDDDDDDVDVVEENESSGVLATTDHRVHYFDAAFLALPAEELAELHGDPARFRFLWDAVSRNPVVRVLARFRTTPPTLPNSGVRAATHVHTHAPTWRQIEYLDDLPAERLHRILRLPDAATRLRERARSKGLATFDAADLDVHYWKRGTHSWKPALKCEEHRERALQPDAKQPWFVLGSSLSRAQHWMEGALETLEGALERWRRYLREGWLSSASHAARGRHGSAATTSRRPLHAACKSDHAQWTMDEVRARRWVVLDSYVYDVAEIVPRHPGGAALLENVRGQDISRVYHRVRHSAAARAWVEEHCVGRLVSARSRSRSRS